MKLKAYLYCDPRSLNDATNYYVGLIKECLIERGLDFVVVHNLSEIRNPHVIITITARFFLVAKLRFPKVKTIFWAQGVSAAEALMSPKSLKRDIRYEIRRISESVAINHSTILFCVSKAMVDYYRKEYGYKNKDNLVVMPCYNLNLSPDFNLSQYEKPTFSYAGGSSKWQGIDLMLQVYKLVEDRIPEAKIIICTNDIKTFQDKIGSLNIKNFEIKYVPVRELQSELHKYKYGFIIRDRHIVNEVATPTKMNSYLANYMIPIYSEAVQDFKDNLKLNKFSLCAELPLDAYSIANKIVEFEKTEHDFLEWKEIVTNTFNNHYNDDKYKQIINKQLNKLI